MQQQEMPRGRNTALDGLRGWAAVAVVFYHAILAADPPLVDTLLHRSVLVQRGWYAVLEKLVLSTLNGEWAVQIFFAISGVVLFRSLGKLHRHSWFHTAWAFALRRIIRIWPTMAVALIGTAGVFLLASHILPGVVVYDARALGRNLLLREYEVIGATWTLYAELAMVPGLLLCFFFTRLAGRLAIPACLAYTLVALRLHGLVFGDAVLNYALPFALGGAAIEAGFLTRLLCSRLAGALLPLSLAGAVLSFVFLPQGGMRYLLQLGFVTLLVGWVAAAPRRAVRQALQARFSQYLGRISYSFYLWNVPVFETLLYAVGLPNARAHPLPIGLAIGLAGTLIALPLADLSERWLEQPSITLGRRLTRRRGERIPPPLQPSPGASSVSDSACSPPSNSAAKA